ncbi:hypothetical protein GJU40_14000 [Bacillus lacus]|uniref:Uncharacterized protein n=1 Tax=Metabacillus lacus TaxID=1983721 RepID=A0A7X2J0U7_9BACI|nr:hypothetical protein [Metabacillus lacus]MRX73256.1 hypothetical protein [Metabacillus lacus]
MNQHKQDYLLKTAVNKLPEAQKKLYQYVVELENELAEAAETADQFMNLLVKHSPHGQAAITFNMTFQEVYEEMENIERCLALELQNMKNHAKWLHLMERDRFNKTFLFLC